MGVKILLIDKRSNYVNDQIITSADFKYLPEQNNRVQTLIHSTFTSYGSLSSLDPVQVNYRRSIFDQNGHFFLPKVRDLNLVLLHGGAGQESQHFRLLEYVHELNIWRKGIPILVYFGDPETDFLSPDGFWSRLDFEKNKHVRFWPIPIDENSYQNERDILGPYQADMWRDYKGSKKNSVNLNVLFGGKQLDLPISKKEVPLKKIVFLQKDCDDRRFSTSLISYLRSNCKSESDFFDVDYLTIPEDLVQGFKSWIDENQIGAYDAIVFDFSYPFDSQNLSMHYGLFQAIIYLRESNCLKPLHTYSNEPKQALKNLFGMSYLFEFTMGHFHFEFIQQNPSLTIRGIHRTLEEHTCYLKENLAKEESIEYELFFRTLSTMKLQDFNEFLAEKNKSYRENFHGLEEDLFSTKNFDAAFKRLSRLKRICFDLESQELRKQLEKLDLSIRSYHETKKDYSIEAFRENKHEIIQLIESGRETDFEQEVQVGNCRGIWFGAFSPPLNFLSVQDWDICLELLSGIESQQFNRYNLLVLEINAQEELGIAMEKLEGLRLKIAIHLVFPDARTFKSHLKAENPLMASCSIIHDIYKDGVWQNKFLRSLIKLGAEVEREICEIPTHVSWHKGNDPTKHTSLLQIYAFLRNHEPLEKYAGLWQEIASDYQERIIEIQSALASGETYSNRIKVMTPNPTHDWFERSKEGTISFFKNRMLARLLFVQALSIQSERTNSYFEDSWEEKVNRTLNLIFLNVPERSKSDKLNFRKSEIRDLNSIRKVLLPEEHFVLEMPKPYLIFKNDGLEGDFQESESSGHPWKILHIDDDPNKRDLINSLLGDSAPEIGLVSISDYAEAMSLLNDISHEYRVVVCDWRILEENGMDWKYLQCSDFLQLVLENGIGKLCEGTNQNTFHASAFFEVIVLTSKETAIKQAVMENYAVNVRWFHKNDLENETFRNQFISEVKAAGDKMHRLMIERNNLFQFKSDSSLTQSHYKLLECYRRLFSAKNAANSLMQIEHEADEIIEGMGILVPEEEWPIGDFELTVSHNPSSPTLPQERGDFNWIIRWLIAQKVFDHFATQFQRISKKPEKSRSLRSKIIKAIVHPHNYSSGEFEKYARVIFK